MTEETFNAIMDKKLAEFRLMANMSVDQIARLCELFSTPVCEVHAHIECVDGKPSAFLVRTVRAEAIPKYLKRVI